MLFFPFVFVLKLVMLCFLSFSSQCQTKTDYSVCDCWGMVPALVAKEQENQCVMWWMSMLMKDSSDNPWLCEGCTFCWDVCMYLLFFEALQNRWRAFFLLLEGCLNCIKLKVPLAPANSDSCWKWMARIMDKTRDTSRRLFFQLPEVLFAHIIIS